MEQTTSSLWEQVLSALENGSNAVNGVLSYVLIVVLLIGGFLFTVRTKFAQFRLLPEQFRAVMEAPSDKQGVSSFQALMVSTASRVGTGNIIGVSSAICLGGFGAVFWMWLIAIIGAASALVESTLAQIYKKRGKDGSYGGPAYYIEQAFGLRWLAVLFSVLLIVTYGFGFNMLASFNLQSTFSGYSFYNLTVGKLASWLSLDVAESVAGVNLMPWLIGFVVAALVAVCLFGGGKRIVKITTILVPIMGVAYLLVAVIIVLINLPLLPSVLKEVFTDAFDVKAIFGGFTGSCVMYGVKRGLFSNEAGVGSAPNASASADVSHPIKQGLVQVLSVFIDTLLVCSATAFMCMCSGVTPTEDMEGAPYVQAALQSTLGDFGPIFITAAMILFAFTTLLGNLYYVDRCVIHILKREPSRTFRSVYYIVAALVIFIGAGLSAKLLWNIADITMALMTLINIPVICILGKYVYRALADYEAQRKAGKDPIFKAKNIGLPHDVDYWK